MSIVVGLAGAHSTGKSTLISYVADSNPFVTSLQSDAANIHAKLGLTVQGDISFEDRMRLQWAILDSHVKRLKEAVAKVDDMGGVLLDRTPMDMYAYTVSAVQPEKLSDEENHELERYYQACVEVVQTHYSGIMVIPPTIAFVASEHRPAYSDVHRRKIAALIDSLVRGDDNVTDFVKVQALPKEVTDLAKRGLLLSAFYQQVLAASIN